MSLFEGATCSECPSGFFPTNNQCERCGPAWLVIVVLLVFVALGVGAYFAYPHVMAMLQTGPAAGGGRPRGGRGAPVVVAVARRGDLPLYLDEIGTVTALNLIGEPSVGPPDLGP